MDVFPIPLQASQSNHLGLRFDSSIWYPPYRIWIVLFSSDYQTEILSASPFTISSRCLMVMIGTILSADGFSAFGPAHPVSLYSSKGFRTTNPPDLFICFDEVMSL